MHHLEIDWLLLAQRAPAWQALPAAARRALLTDAMAQTNGLERPLVRALRAMHRHRILADHDEVDCVAYLHDNLTAAERQHLGELTGCWGRVHDPAIAEHVASTGWINDALNGGRRLPGEQRPAMRALLRTVLEAGGVLPVAELRQVKKVPADRIATVVTAALQHVLLFATLRSPDDAPVLVIWPPAFARLRRPKPAVPRRLAAPAEVFRFPIVAEDAATVLVAVSAEPTRLRGNDGRLFERAAQRLEQALTPLPAWAGGICGGWSHAVRINSALHFLRSAQLVRHAGTAGRDLRLEPTAAARAWLAQSPADRHRHCLKLARGRLAAYLGDTTTMAVDSDDVAGILSDYSAPQRYFATESDSLRKAVASAFGAIGPGEFVEIGNFIEYHAQAHSNPLLTAGTWGYRAATVEARERHFANLLGSIMVNHLMPLAGVAHGVAAADRYVFTVTNAGRYLLGIADTLADADLTRPGPEGRTGLIVQADYAVVFLAPAPAAEAAIGRFAARTAAGSVGSLFLITPAAVQTAAAAGLTGAAMLETLRQHA
ncbi:MAG: hypothetical protein ACT443_11665, partial [Gemmatimonadota bacterium]